MYIHSPVARTFSVAQFVCAHPHIFMRVHIHAWLECLQKGVCICVVSHHPAISCLMSNPSLLFPHGHFETTPDCDFTDDPVHTFLPYLLVLKAQDTRNFARTPRSLATWPNPVSTQHGRHEQADGREGDEEDRRSSSQPNT